MELGIISKTRHNFKDSYLAHMMFDWGVVFCDTESIGSGFQ
jgi:hypothetical protein